MAAGGMAGMGTSLTASYGSAEGGSINFASSRTSEATCFAAGRVSDQLVETRSVEGSVLGT